VLDIASLRLQVGAKALSICSLAEQPATSRGYLKSRDSPPTNAIFVGLQNLTMEFQLCCIGGGVVGWRAGGGRVRDQVG
jgi:hypothetical protein